MVKPTRVQPPRPVPNSVRPTARPAGRRSPGRSRCRSRAHRRWRRASRARRSRSASSWVRSPPRLATSTTISPALPAGGQADDAVGVAVLQGVAEQVLQDVLDRPGRCGGPVTGHAQVHVHGLVAQDDACSGHAVQQGVGGRDGPGGRGPGGRRGVLRCPRSGGHVAHHRQPGIEPRDRPGQRRAQLVDAVRRDPVAMADQHARRPLDDRQRVLQLVRGLGIAERCGLFAPAQLDATGLLLGGGRDQDVPVLHPPFDDHREHGQHRRRQHGDAPRRRIGSKQHVARGDIDEAQHRDRVGHDHETRQQPAEAAREAHRDDGRGEEQHDDHPVRPGGHGVRVGHAVGGQHDRAQHVQHRPSRRRRRSSGPWRWHPPRRRATGDRPRRQWPHPRPRCCGPPACRSAPRPGRAGRRPGAARARAHLACPRR